MALETSSQICLRPVLKSALEALVAVSSFPPFSIPTCTVLSYAMDVDNNTAPQEVEEVLDDAQDHEDGAQQSNKKKRKIRPYHRIHAHRNPLSDAPME